MNFYGEKINSKNKNSDYIWVEIVILIINNTGKNPKP